MHVRDEIGKNPLMRASLANNADVARLLIEHQADLNAHTNNGVKVLMIASANKSMDVARLLIDHDAKSKPCSAVRQTEVDINSGVLAPHRSNDN